jgi:hypothetical protein
MEGNGLLFNNPPKEIQGWIAKNVKGLLEGQRYMLDEVAVYGDPKRKKAPTIVKVTFSVISESYHLFNAR